MDTVSANYLSELAAPFLDPNKRVFWGYLGSSLIIALFVQIILAGVSTRRALTHIFSRRVWFSPSARADYKVLFINQALMMGIGPRLISKLAVATLLFESLHIWFDGRAVFLSGSPAWVIAGLFTLSIFLMDDISKYLVHRALHRWPVLWAFHKVHHTAETLTPLTIYRTHPVEAIIFSLRSIIVQALVIGSFLFFFGSRVEILTVLGANVVLFLFNALGSNLRHSHVRISYGKILEHIFISPAQHQVHHSVAHRHHDQNFGAVLAIWDWLGGSLTTAEEKKVIRFGTSRPQPSNHTMRNIYLLPFIEATQTIFPLYKKVPSGMQFVTQGSVIRFLILFSGTFAIGLIVSVSSVFAGELNIYSHRQPFLINPFIEAYKKETGTKINIIYAKKGLAQRLKVEGPLSPADVVLTVDIARLYTYVDKDLLAEVSSDVLRENIPEHLRDPQNRWFAFSKRARVLAVSRQSSDATGISRYEELANPKWKGRICSRPGSHVYNRALVASMISALGEEKAEAWAKGVFGNLARRPQGNDRAQVKAIAEGVCDIAIINNYYFGKLKNAKESEQREWASSVKLIFPNQSDRGAHVNISGGGIAKHSKNKKEAQRFLEFLTSERAQKLYAEVNYEYPVNKRVPFSKELASWGHFSEDKLPIIQLAELAPKAQMIIDRVGW
ncbi:MAG: hypothetical protein CMM26_09015 [Rhodospirillaceae bacterium]|nr:hypothetical protein [Rhodospirillaceae bacterium]